jgi:hypothetical protein
VPDVEAEKVKSLASNMASKVCSIAPQTPRYVSERMN